MKPIKLSHLYIAMGLTLTVGGFQNCSKMGVSDIAVEDIGRNSQMGLEDPALSDPQLADNADSNGGSSANNNADLLNGDMNGDGLGMNLDMIMGPDGILRPGSDNSTDITGTTPAGAPGSIVDAPTLTQIFDNLPEGTIRPINLDSVGEEDDSTVLTPEDYSRPYSGICSLFEGIQLPIPLNASTDDYEYKHVAGTVKILEARDVTIKHGAIIGGALIGSARNVDIHHVAGGVIVKGAQSVQVKHEAGQIRITANEIPEIKHMAGAACLNAVKIGVLAHVAGGSKIIAKEIEEIKHYAGTIHIYGAKVKKIKHAAGRVCLHDGAVLLNASHVIMATEGCE